MFGRVALLSLLLAVTGCSFIESDAGKAHYSMTPVIVDGQVVCCAVDIRNAKDIGRVKASVTKLPDGSLEVTLEEEGVQASGPMGAMIQQQAATTDLIRSLIPLLPPTGGVP